MATYRIAVGAPPQGRAAPDRRRAGQRGRPRPPGLRPHRHPGRPLARRAARHAAARAPRPSCARTRISGQLIELTESQRARRPARTRSRTARARAPEPPGPNFAPHGEGWGSGGFGSLRTPQVRPWGGKVGARVSYPGRPVRGEDERHHRAPHRRPVAHPKENPHDSVPALGPRQRRRRDALGRGHPADVRGRRDVQQQGPRGRQVGLRRWPRADHHRDRRSTPPARARPSPTGPYSEAKEFLGGFWVIEAADLDEALQWAKEGSAACGGRVEVRPFAGRGVSRTRPRRRSRCGRRRRRRPRRVRPRRRGAHPSLRRHRPRRGRPRRGARHRARAVAAATASRPTPPGGSPRRRAARRWTTCAANASGTRSTPRPPCSPTTRPRSPPDPVTDDRLRLIFTCCHPALAEPARVALTLRLLGGLTVAEIARAFLVPETTMAQRITRAKAKIAKARIPYRVPGPRGPRRAPRRRARRALPRPQRGLPQLGRRRPPTARTSRSRRSA